MWVLSYLLMTALMFLGLFLIGLILLQRGRGGGLAGAFGGMGGQSAFGTKAGDVFTRITIGVAAAWILLCAGSVVALHHTSGNRADANLFKAGETEEVIKAAPKDAAQPPLNDDLTAPATSVTPGQKPEGQKPADAPVTVPATKSEVAPESKPADAPKTEEKKTEEKPAEEKKAEDKPVEEKKPEPAPEKPAEPKPAEPATPETKPETPPEKKPE